MGALQFKRGVYADKPVLAEGEIYVSLDTSQIIVGNPTGTDFVYDINSVLKSLVTTKGDLLVASASATLARLGVGTNTHVLTADSTATNGIKWAAAAASSGSYINKFISGNLYVMNSASAFFHLIFFPEARTIASIDCGVVTAPTGANIIMNFLYHATAPGSATTIFSTAGNKPTIAASAYISSTSGVPDTTAMAANSFLLVCVEQIGSTIAGADLSYEIKFS